MKGGFYSFIKKMHFTSDLGNIYRVSIECIFLSYNKMFGLFFLSKTNALLHSYKQKYVCYCRWKYTVLYRNKTYMHTTN